MPLATMPWSPKARAFWPILLALLIADCATKELAERYLVPESVPHAVAGNVIRLTLAHNAGAAMSLSLGRYSRIGFSLAALFALVVLARFYRSAPATARGQATALALIVGGAAGNLLNRWVSPRGVTDFIDIGVRSWRFWTFNVADAGITIGAALLLVVLHRSGSFAEDRA
jgi:signal peptidase II